MSIGRPRLTQPGYYDGPPIPLTQDCVRYRKDCKLGSTVLGHAIRDLINRMDALDVARALGAFSSPEPGTEQVHKTSSASRLAA